MILFIDSEATEVTTNTHPCTHAVMYQNRVGADPMLIASGQCRHGAGLVNLFEDIFFNRVLYKQRYPCDHNMFFGCTCGYMYAYMCECVSTHWIIHLCCIIRHIGAEDKMAAIFQTTFSADFLE